MLEMIARAIRELVETGGRISVEVSEWVDKILAEGSDDGKQMADAVATHLEERLETRFQEIETRLSELEGAVMEPETETMKRGSK